MDNGVTSFDNYDAFNRRIMHVTGNGSTYRRYEYGLDGRVTDVWQNEETYENLARYYGPKGDSFAYWTGGVNLSNEQVHYQHTDYLGTVKARTDPNHNLEGTYSDLPFGERTAISGTDDNAEHYAMLDRDTESDTHHAQFRTYEPRIGRWLQPDPYDGSYDYNNPQSWNRYSYVRNNPLGVVDPSGLIAGDGAECGGEFQPPCRPTYSDGIALGTGSPMGRTDPFDLANYFLGHMATTFNYTEYVHGDPVQRSVTIWSTIPFPASLTVGLLNALVAEPAQITQCAAYRSNVVASNTNI